MDTTSRVRPGYAWYVVGVLMLAYVSSFIDRQILALLVDPIKRDLGISDTRMSVLMGVSFAAFYSILGLPIGRLADHRSRRGIIGWGIAVWSLMTAVSGLARTYWQLLAARVGVGVGEAALSPPAYSLIADYFPRERLGTAISVYSLGIYLGSGIALMLGGWVVSLVGGAATWPLPLLGPVRPWQAVFIAVGLPGLLLAFLVRTIREPRRGAPERRSAVTRISVAEVAAYVRRHRGAFLSHNLGFALIAMVNYGWAFWIPSFLMRVHGWTPRHAGLIYGLWTATFGVAGVVAGGYVGDVLIRTHADAKLRVGIIGASLQIVCALLFLLAPTTFMEAALIPATFFASFGFGAAAAGVQEISPAPMRGQTSALYLFLVNLIGLGIGPTLVASFTDYVYRDELAIGKSLLVVSLAGLFAAILTFRSGLGRFREASRAARDWPAPSPAGS